ncbi:MAG: hypothetical protein IJE46_03265 [Clostridia bacterium]|nr:hypothetical protein [Clostridia bacterium]
MKNKRFISVMVVVVLICAAATYIAYAKAGTEEDPVVTLSYINDVLKQEMTFKVVEVPAGKLIIGDTGTEMVLRMGKGSILATAKGGVADLTAGNDLPNGSSIPANHYLLIPYNDGRGLSVTTDSLIMVKGSYEIK